VHSTDAAYCYKHRTFRGLSACVSSTPMSPAKSDEPIEVPIGSRLACDHGLYYSCESTLAPYGEYDDSICVKTMRFAATITVATCYIVFLTNVLSPHFLCVVLTRNSTRQSITSAYSRTLPLRLYKSAESACLSLFLGEWHGRRTLPTRPHPLII